MRVGLWRWVVVLVEDAPSDESGSARGEFAVTEGTEILEQREEDVASPGLLPGPFFVRSRLQEIQHQVRRRRHVASDQFDCAEGG